MESRHRPEDSFGLARKVGIKSGQAVCLLNAPGDVLASLARQSKGVRFSTSLGDGRYDIIIFWPARSAELARFAELQSRVSPDGAIWAVIPKKHFAQRRGVDFTWEDMQAAALETDLDDNKVVSVSDEEYATRFVIRKSRRHY